jgi:hypothetical protein
MVHIQDLDKAIACCCCDGAALIQDLDKTGSAIQLWRVVLIQDLDKTGSEPRSSLAVAALDSGPSGVDALGLLDGPALVGVLALDCFIVGRRASSKVGPIRLPVVAKSSERGRRLVKQSDDVPPLPVELPAPLPALPVERLDFRGWCAA